MTKFIRNLPEQQLEHTNGTSPKDRTPPETFPVDKSREKQSPLKIILEGSLVSFLTYSLTKWPAKPSLSTFGDDYSIQYFLIIVSLSTHSSLLFLNPTD